MNRWLLLVFFSLGPGLPGRPQRVHSPVAGRIDSLTAEGTRHVMDPSPAIAQALFDSAYRLAITCGDDHDRAQALRHLADLADAGSNDFIAAARLVRESLVWYGRTADKRGLERATVEMAFTLFVRGYYDSALAYAKQAYELFDRAGDNEGRMDALALWASVYTRQGQFDQGFERIREIVQLADQAHDNPRRKVAIACLGLLCMAIEDYPRALQYYHSVFDDLTSSERQKQRADDNDVWAHMEFAESYAHLGFRDSALARYNLFDSARAPDKDLRIFLVSKAEFYMLGRQYETALPNLLRGLSIHQRLGDMNEIMRTELDLAKVYQHLHQPARAFIYSHTGLANARRSNNRQFIRDGARILSELHEAAGHTDSAFRYYRAGVQEAQAIASDQTKGKFASLQYEEQIRSLATEKLLAQQKAQIREQELVAQQLPSRILFSVALAVLIASLFGVTILWLRRRNEKLREENTRRKLEQESAEMQMQALRTQMNPHFIFNCLNSINRFILKSETEAASDYLTRFSRLIRQVLNNSKESWIPLEEEIATIKLYLEMESLRFRNAFDYELRLEQIPDPGAVSIPPMLLQPFLENAIWHGLMHKRGKGLVTIGFRVSEGALDCIIEDNGVGRKAAAASRSQATHKSMGIAITRQRLNLINGNDAEKTVDLHIDDLADESGAPAGTRVALRIRTRHPVTERFHDNTLPNLIST